MVDSRVRRGIAMLTVGLLVAAGCGGDDDDAEDDAGEMVVLQVGGSFGAAFDAAFLVPFGTESGVDVSQVEGGDDPIAAVTAQVEADNVQWDVVDCIPSFVAATPDIFQEIDRDIVQSTDDLVSPSVVTDKFMAINIQAFPLVAYSTEEFPDQGPSGWADFFNVETFPGPRGVPDVGLESASTMPAAALLADGVAAEDLLPLDLDRAYAKLDELKPHVRVFWTSFVQGSDILRNGEVVMTVTTDGRGQQLMAAGAPVGITYNEAFSVPTGLCVPVGSPNPDNAFNFMEYILSHPEQQAVFTSLTFYGPVTEAGVAAVEAQGRVSDFSTLHTDEMIPTDTEEWLDYVEQNSDELLNRWNAWVAG
jgi:spermidine/putrescine-binding protein